MQWIFTYSPCGLFTKKKKKKMEKSKETSHIKIYITWFKIYLSKQTTWELLSTWHGDFKNFPGWTASDKALHNKAFNIAKNGDGYKRGLASLVYRCLDKKFSAGAVQSKITLKQQLAEKLRKLIIRKFEIRKIHSSLKGK